MNQKNKIATIDNTVVNMIATLEALREKTRASESEIDTHSDQRRWLDVASAEKYSGCGRWTLARAAKAGKIKCSKLSSARSGKVLIERASIDSWLERCRWKPSQ